MNSVEQIFQQAAARHQEGRLQDAERLYRSILKTQPKHPEANHNLGMIAIQSKRPDAALPYFQTAIEANPNQSRFRLSHVYALIQAGQMDAAQQALARSLHLELGREAVAALVGVLEEHSGKPNPQQVAKLKALCSEGRFSEAAAFAQTMTARFPLHAIGWMALGMANAQMGKIADALASMEMAAALSPNDAEAHYNLCLAFKDLGRLEEADASCQRALAIRPDFADAHRNRGNILQDLGRLTEAEASYRQALQLVPDFAEAHSNLGVTLQEQGRVAEAEASCRRALEIDPNLAQAHGNLGNTLQEQGRLAEAEASYRRALKIKPEYALAHSNLGGTLKDLGRALEAEASYRRALQIDPDYADAHYNLGVILLEQGRADEAEASYRRALELRQDFADALNNLASLLIVQGKSAMALNMIKQSLAIKETWEAKSVFVNCVKRLRFTQVESDLRAALVRALGEPWARPSELVPVCTNLVKLDPRIQGCLARSGNAWPGRLSARDLFGADELTALAADPLLRALLEAAPICDGGMERFLTMARHAMLEAACGIAAGTTASDAGTGAALNFYGALANQCFINEYVFAHTDGEIQKAGELRESLVAALDAGTRLPALSVLAVAAYFPLGSLPGASRLLDIPWPEAVTAVLVQQIREPEEERQLRPTIPRMTGIEDQVSLMVQNQYEENPYPRWVKAAPGGKARDIDGHLRQLFPLASFERQGAGGSIDVLIAGCGTGQHSIQTAQLLRGARILAVDLSMNSLGYAKRKTRELGMTSIEYAQADLLQLGLLDRSFDVIESIGVLHHLADPWAGWRGLLSVLRPGGFMQLGFYSEVARRSIVKARAFIAEQGYGTTPNEIRRCRQALLDRDAGAEFGTTTTISDFFSISACRDLLFHVQEHRMTLTRIDAFLRENRLAFLGLSIEADVRHAYKQRFPDDPAALNLSHWQEFENENPDTFLGMYQFWVQKAE